MTICAAVAVASSCAHALVARAADSANARDDKFEPAAIEFFEKKIRPLLAARCFPCHGPDSKHEGELRLESRETILAGGGRGRAIQPGKPEESLLIRAINYGDELKMPPKAKLPPQEIADLVAWVKMGAPWPVEPVASQAPTAESGSVFTEQERSFWSFQPVVDPRVPSVKKSEWPKSPLDHFILAGLEAARLEPAPSADKRTLIRRATFDLIGLPPTPNEIDVFLADDSPDAFAKVVDRLLTSPHYGERWGRHWLDVARYADSNGMDENLAYGNAFRYRDYVVAAFNRDKPYDEFIREQLAGDLLLDPPHVSPLTTHHISERLIATGFLMLGPKMLAEDDPMKMEMDIIDEQVDTIGRTFLGLTLGCARCHDHKYDPIRMEDYYSLAGIFKSTQTMDNFKVVARWHERPLGTKEEIERQQVQQKQIADKKSEITRLTDAANESLLVTARRRAGNYLSAATELRRQQSLLKDLKSQISDSESLPPGAIVVEAEDFTRGNVKREFTGYGEKIGVIYNQGELPNSAEYDIEIAEAGAFQIELRYAAAESRPVRISVNGRLVRADAAGKVTGSWFPDTQTWSPEGVVALAAGKNTIRLERDQPFPHFDKLALVPSKTIAGAITTAPKTTEQIAAERGLIGEFIQQWSKYLEQSKSDPNSVLRAWHAVTELPAALLATDLFLDLKASAEKALAVRYQELFDEADRQWHALKETPEGKNAKELPDPANESLRKVLYDSKGPFSVPPKPESHYPAETSAELKRLRDELAALEKSFTPLPEAMSVSEGKVENLRVHLRGNHLTLGTEVPRRFPRILAGDNQTPLGDQQSGRLQLAEWLTRPDHPLTARVLVNRLWRWHFGEAIVRSTDNFGRLGDRPANPQLLEWLAARFVESGWSIKAMHRVIMLSSAYQMSTAYNEKAASIDPENRLHWRMNRRRLEAESIRDAMLAASGQLDPAIGGSLFQGNNRAYVPGYPNSNYDKYNFNRRSIYLPVLRSNLYEVFQAFDFADPSTPNGERPTTTIAPQALFMMNSQLVAEQSKHLAATLLSDARLDDTGRVHLAYKRVFGRPAIDQEIARALDFIGRYTEALRASNRTSDDGRHQCWQALCRTLLASSEFIFVD